MVRAKAARERTAFTQSIEAREGVSTGISAHDRARTISTAIDPTKDFNDIVSPGHVFPLVAKEGGVLVRAGHTEAAVDISRLAGLNAAGVICEIMKDDGSMARLPDLVAFAQLHGLKIGTIADLIAYRNDVDQFEHVALVKGEVEGAEDVLVRMHSECLTGDVFHSLRCDCGEQLDAAMRMIEAEGRGAIVYLRQEGRGIGLVNKLRAYTLQDEGMDTVEANEKLGFRPDLRDYGIGAQILLDLGLSSIRILTNNPKKIVGIDGYGLSVTEQVPLGVKPNPHNKGYLRAKRDKLGHLFPSEGGPAIDEQAA
jgi:3,4-dihydroxy 2-butanone 4-phosphate synthase/GTP cyclohydrolase II